MDVADEFNVGVLKIWNRCLSEPALMPSHYSSLPKGVRLLVLGMNPAFGEKWVKKQICSGRIGAANTSLLPRDVYGWDPERGPRYVTHLHTIERYAFENYGNYFGPLKRFAAAVGCPDSYSHFDLFHVRDTKQKSCLAQIGSLVSGGGYSLNDFGIEQIRLTVETIRSMRPTAVVIANATASHLALEHLPFALPSNTRTQAVIDGLPNTKFFFSGMLSGGRSMDVFSRARLAEDIRVHLNSR